MRDYVTTAACGIAGPVIAALMCNTRLLDRRRTMAAGALAAGALFVAYTRVQAAAEETAMMCLEACIINLYYGTLYAYTAEVLPSAHRATSNGAAVACNRVMGIVSALVATFGDTSTPTPL